MSLTDAYGLAKNYDPQHKADEADQSINKNQAIQAYSAYMPNVNYQRAQPPYSNATIDYVTVNQPIFDPAKLAQVGQGPARSSYADANFQVKEQELAMRLYKAVSQLMLANEAIEANSMRIKNYGGQAERAKRMYELGQGTVTDMRDIQVKFEMAKADQLTLKTKKNVAEMQVAALTGEKPKANDFQLSDKQMIGEIRRLDEVLGSVRDSNPKLVAARDTEKISKLEALRTKAEFLPVVSLSNITSWGYVASFNPTGGRINYTGITISLPLDAPSVVGAFSASANATKASEIRRDAEEQAMVQAHQLYETVETGRQALKIKQEAVKAAELSVEANTKSSQAGVRSMVDVLNSIDILYQAKNDYAVTTSQVGEALLQLLLISGHSTREAVEQTQLFLFAKR